jgi:hypothetical protein
MELAGVFVRGRKGGVPMLPGFRERSIQLTGESTIAVFILVGAHPGDAEFVPLRPRPADAAMWAEIRSRWAGRELREAGVLGVVGGNVRCAFKEPLDEPCIAALAEAFVAYCETLAPGRIGKGDEVEWLERLWALPDPRAEI